MEEEEIQAKDICEKPEEKSVRWKIGAEKYKVGKARSHGLCQMRKECNRG